MKRNAIVVIGVLVLLAGCSSKKIVDSGGGMATLNGVVFEDKAPGKRLTLKFSPSVPSYEVAHQKDGKASEIRWRVTSTTAINKEFNFAERGSGLKRAMISVEPQKQTATL